MQHDGTADLENDKTERGRESKMAADTKNSKTNKVIFFFVFFFRRARYIIAEILYGASGGLYF